MIVKGSWIAPPELVQVGPCPWGEAGIHWYALGERWYWDEAVLWQFYAGSWRAVCPVAVKEHALQFSLGWSHACRLGAAATELIQMR